MQAVNSTLTGAAGTPHMQNVPNSAVAATKRKTEWRVMMNVFVLLVALLPVAIYEIAVQPSKRGFFCNDETIQYPFHPSTVNAVMLGVLVVPLPVLIVVFVEWMRYRNLDRLSDAKLALCCCKMPAWLLTAMAVCGHYFVSMVLSFDFVEVAKFSIGRLRPHFLAVCQPQLPNGSTCADPQNQNRYIEDYTCLAAGYTAADVRQAQLSFPSGHSSMIFHTMVFLTLYLHRRITWPQVSLLRPLVQFALLSIAWFTALSRVMDYWHHWSDVLVGLIIGIVSAVLYMWYVMHFFDGGATPDHQYNLAPQNHTLATLEEVYATHQHVIPPAYVTVDSKDFQNVV